MTDIKNIVQVVVRTFPITANLGVIPVDTSTRTLTNETIRTLTDGTTRTLA